MAELQKIIDILELDGIVVVRTDTIYGIIAKASSKEAVEKVYAVKKRDASKQCIVLISQSNSVAHGDQVKEFSQNQKIPTSVVVPAADEPSWILCGGKDVAYRIVKDKLLKNIIDAVGPVIAPSANPEGKQVARNIAEARKYFGDTVDLYVDGGEVPKTVHASQIIRIDADGSVEQLR